MDDDESSKNNNKEPSDHNFILEYPLIDGFGNQFNIQYNEFMPSYSFFQLPLPKIPISQDFKSYREYSYGMKKWYISMESSFSRCLLPTTISLFYRRPFRHKISGRRKNLITSEQFLKIEKILIDGLRFNDSSFLKENIKNKSNLVSEHISSIKKWIGWLIPPFPEPDFFQCFDDFFIAVNKWYTICTEILNECAHNFISKNNENEERSLYLSAAPNSFDSNSNIRHISSKNHSINKNIRREKSHFWKPFPHPPKKDSSSNDDINNSFNDQNETSNDDINNNFNDKNDTNDDDTNDNNCNDEDEILNNQNIQNDEEITIFSQDYLDDDKDKLTKIDFDFINHPISFHLKYNIEIYRNDNTKIINQNDSTLIPLKVFSNNSFFDVVKTNYKCKFDNDQNSKEALSKALKNLHNFHLNDVPIQPYSKTSTLTDLINYGCFYPIRNSYLPPILDNSDDNVSVMEFLFLLDLNEDQISEEHCKIIFEYVIANHNNELFQNLLNSNLFIYKIAIFLSYFIPSSSPLKSIQIIEPFDENDIFLNINGYGEKFHLTSEIRFKLDLREIHGLLVQWHLSDVIYRIFGLIQNDNDRISKAAETFSNRALLYKNSFHRLAEKKKFPFNFLLTIKENLSLLFSEKSDTCQSDRENGSGSSSKEKSQNDQDHSNLNGIENDVTSLHHKDEYLAHSYGEFDSPLKENSSLSNLMLKMPNSLVCKTFNLIPTVSQASTSLSSDFSDSLSDEFICDSFFELIIKVFKISILYNVSDYVCPNGFYFLRFISQNCRYKVFKKLITDILFDCRMCRQFLIDFTEYKVHIKFGLSDSPELIHFANLLFKADIQKLSKSGVFKVTDFEWLIRFFQHLTKYLIDSYLHVSLVESILRFAVHSIDSDNCNQWLLNVMTLQGLLYAYIPYEGDWKMLSSELRSFSLLMKSSSSFDFFNTSEKIRNIFHFLTFSENSEVLRASWKILRNIFVYHCDVISSILSKHEELYRCIENAISPLKNLNEFNLVGCELLKTLTKLIELSFPLEKYSRLKLANNRNYFAILTGKFILKGLTEFLKILNECSVRPNAVCAALKSALKLNENSGISHFIKIVMRYEVAVSSRPPVKKLFVSYNIESK